MLSITTVQLQGWKGLNRTIEPKGHTLLCGPNGSGKSAVLEAVRWAVEGRMSVGATLAAVATFAAPEGCKVTVTLSDGFAWTRGVTINHDTGAISQNLEIHGRSELSIRDAHAEIAAKCGDFAPMFDLGAGFLDLSDDKRRNFLLELCARASQKESTSRVVAARIIRAFLAGLGIEQDADTLSIRIGTDTAPDDAKVAAALHRRLVDELAGNLPEMVAQAISICRESVNANRREKDRAAAACDKISERRAAIAPIAESKTNLDAELARLRESMLVCERAISNQEGRASARQSLLDQIKQAQRQVENHRAQLVANTRPDETILEGLRTRVNELAKRIDAVGDIGARLSVAMQANQKASNRLLELSAEKDLVEERLSGDWAKLADAMAVLGPYLYLPNPEAKQAWHEIALIVSAHAASIPKDRARAAALVEEMNAARDARIRANDEENATQSEMAALQDLRNEHRDTLRELTELDRKGSRAAEIDRNIDAWSTTAAELQDKLGAFDMEAFDSQTGAAGSLDALRERLLGIQIEINDVEAATLRLAEQSALESEHTKLIADAKLHTVKWRVAQGVGEAAKSLRSELMDELTRPLLEPMTQCLRLFDGQSKAYCRLEDEKGTPTLELGWQRGDRKTAYEALSAGEKCIFGAALARALIAIADPPLKVLMLEAGEVDEQAINTLMDAIGGIHGAAEPAMQTIVATWNSRLLLDDGWKAVEMGAYPEVAV